MCKLPIHFKANILGGVWGGGKFYRQVIVASVHHCLIWRVIHIEVDLSPS